MTRRRTLCATLVAFAVARDAGAELPTPTVKVSIGSHYSVGDYGTSSTTEIFYEPLTVKAELGRWSLRATVPYLRIDSGGGVTQGPNGPVQAQKGTNDGLGDVLARGAYTLPSPSIWLPWTELAGLVKFPTASRSRGLGTGRFDFAIESAFTWSVRRVSPFVSVEYRVLGSSPSIPLRNVLGASAGAQYRVYDALHLGALVDYRQAASATSRRRLEVIPFAAYRVRPHWSFDLYGSAGLADGSPDAGVGLELGYTL